ncbi:MAG: molybdopterin oxidoreductase family protein [Brevinemataceae bacterium]
MKKKQTTCNYCSLACNFDAYTENDLIIRLEPTSNYPVNKGFSCIKGLSLHKQLSKFNDRPLPRIKENGEFRFLSTWEEGYQYVADKLAVIKKEYGGDAIAGISTGQLCTEEMALFGHIMRNFLGGNVDGNTRLCMATSVVAHKQSFGFDAPPYTLNDFELSDTIIFIGANPIVAHPIIWNRVRLNQNKKIVVIDPRCSETAKHADMHLELTPKSDLKLFYTLANYLIEKDWINHDYINNYTENFEEFKTHVAEFTLDKLEETTGITPKQLKDLATLIHNSKNVSLWWTMGVNQGYEAVRTAQSIINIALMTGNIGRPGTGANSITGQCNAMGSRVYSNTSGLYGGGDYDNENRRNAVAQALDIDPTLLPTKPTLPYNVIIEKIISGEIKALWVCCTNPRHSWTNNEEFKKAVDKLDLFIVQDLYGDTESSIEADVFFPVATGLQKEGVMINTERRLSKLQPIISTSRPSDYQVFYGVAKALNMGSLLKGWETPRSAFELLKKCSKGMPCDMTGVDYDALNDSPGIQWPFREGDTLLENERRLFENNQFYTPSKKAKFIFEAPMENPLAVTKEYPYILNTGRGTVGQWHTQSRTREVSYVNDISSNNSYIFINPELAHEHHIKKFDKVLVKSINGRESVFIAELTSNVPKNQCYAPLHYIETNRLTPSLYDSYSKEPSYKTTPIYIQKVEE